MNNKIDLNLYIAEVKNFPKPGILFKDICPLLATPKAFQYSVSEMAKLVKNYNPDIIVGPESRGFIFGCPLSLMLGIPFIPVRKPGKLPRPNICEKVSTEYSETELCIHKNDIKPNSRILIVDDILATGGTIVNTGRLVEKENSKVVAAIFLGQLEELKQSRAKIHFPIHYLLDL